MSPLHPFDAVARLLGLSTLAQSKHLCPQKIPHVTYYDTADDRGGRAVVAKGRMRALLESIPVHVILNPMTALFGAARYASEKAGLFR